MRKDSKIPAILALFETEPMGYLTRAQIDAAINKKCSHQLHVLTKNGQLHFVQHGIYSRYYATAEAKEAGRADWEFFLSPDEAKKRRREAVRKYDAAHSAARSANALRPAVSAATQQIEMVPKKPAAKAVPLRIHPPKRTEWANMDPIIPPGVKVQVLPGFERFECPYKARMMHEQR